MLYQQGDVLIESVDRLPEKMWVCAPGNSRYILARGEATGHAHAVTEPIRLYFAAGNDNLFCASDTTFTVRHEEHLPLTIPAGLYVIRKVREFDYFSAEKPNNTEFVHD